MVGTPYYCSPEVAFDFAIHDQVAKKYSRGYRTLPSKERLKLGKELGDRMRQKYDENVKDNFKNRYDPQILFGMTWEERYTKWQNYDILPVRENDDPNIDVWDIYLFPPRMLKAGDIWGVGVIAYVLICGRSPFYGPPPIKSMEAAFTREYTFPAKQDYPVVFKVEL